MNRNRAFTLVELLVVAGVFFLMIALLAPFVHMVRQRSHMINCASNLRRISLGLHMYATENRRAFPPNLGTLYPKYVKDEKAFDCPASRPIGTPNGPDYIYRPGLKTSSPSKDIIAEDYNNHKKFKKNVLRVDGSVDWVSVGR